MSRDLAVISRIYWILHHLARCRGQNRSQKPVLRKYFSKLLFRVIINTINIVGLEYKGQGMILDDVKKIHTRCRRINIQLTRFCKYSQTDVAEVRKNSIFPKFDQLPRSVSPSSRGVRSSDYMRCKALDVIFTQNKKFRKIFSQKKVTAR